MVPTIGFELMTYRLQGDCTTTVLSRRGVGDRNRTCIEWICNPTRSRSATPTLNLFVFDTLFKCIPQFIKFYFINGNNAK